MSKHRKLTLRIGDCPQEYDIEVTDLKAIVFAEKPKCEMCGAEGTRSLIDAFGALAPCSSHSCGCIPF